jgi:plastocyanin
VRRLTLAGLTLAAVLAAPGPAFADVIFQAVDEVPGSTPNQWTPSTQTVKVGEPVIWRFAGATLPHNVQSDAGAWTLQSPRPSVEDATYTFTAPGTYTFFCEFHKATMAGTITVADAAGTLPPPPPPPPLSEQPLANDFPGPTALEVRDTVAPTLDRVSVTRARKAAKLRLRLSEAGKVTVKLTRGKTVKRRTLELAKGTSTVTVANLRAGTYRVDVSATDLAGNAAKSPKRTRVTIR